MRYTIIYMAAGNSRRFGKENKLLREFHGRPLYRYGLELLMQIVRERKEAEVIVITQYEEILETIRMEDEKRISCFLNPDSRKGASYTIRRGLLEARKEREADYYLFLTADQPFLKKTTLERFLDPASVDWGQRPVASAAWKDRVGNPVMFRADLAQELMELKEDEGGRKIWRRYAGKGALIHVQNPEELRDLDTPEDFENISTE